MSGYVAVLARFTEVSGRCYGLILEAVGIDVSSEAGEPTGVYSRYSLEPSIGHARIDIPQRNIFLGGSRQVKTASRSPSAQPRPAAFINSSPFPHLPLTHRSPRPAQSVLLRRTMLASVSTMSTHAQTRLHNPPVMVGSQMRRSSLFVPRSAPVRDLWCGTS